MRYRSERQGYLIRCDLDEKVEKCLIDFSEREGIAAAHFWGIGAVKEVVLGAYDVANKTYLTRRIEGTWELLSLIGSLARTDEGPILHMHAVLGDAECRTIGGHVFSLTIAAAGEIYLVAFPGELVRKYDDLTGLKLLDI
jgi:predicted DNA-binding protein with PD1-like motif